MHGSTGWQVRAIEAHNHACRNEVDTRETPGARGIEPLLGLIPPMAVRARIQFVSTQPPTLSTLCEASYVPAGNVDAGRGFVTGTGARRGGRGLRIS